MTTETPGVVPARRLPPRSLGAFIFASRWILYPLNVALLAALALYVGNFLLDDMRFIAGVLSGSQPADSESLMIALLGFVDAAMVANLVVMIVMGSYQIFIRKFEAEPGEMPQFLEHMDTGIQKVKVALSISTITLVQLLKDFVHLEHLDWEVSVHRIEIHLVSLVSTLVMAIIWRVMHPPHARGAEHG
jgi:uncharacterized protein (TIGR00645 family)